MAIDDRSTNVADDELSQAMLESVPPGMGSIVPPSPRVPPPAPSSSGRAMGRPPPLRKAEPAKKISSLPPAGPWRAIDALLAREVEASAATEPTRAALLLAVRARIGVDALSDPLHATRALGRATELAPDARFASSTWRWLAEQGADPALVLQRARAELAQVGDRRERIGLLWQIAAIEEHVVGDLVSAKRTMRELLALDPTDAGVWEAHAGLHLRSRSNDADGWDEARASDETVFGAVTDALDITAQTTEDARMRAALYSATGALRDRYLGDDEAALAALRRAVQADPTNATAQAALEGVLLRRRAWDEYARVVAAEAERTRDARVAAALFERAGDVYAECLGDHGSAAEAYGRASTLEPSDPGAVEKEIAALEASARWTDAEAAYERWLARLRDPLERAWALVRLGGLREEHQKRADEALAAYRAAVDEAPTFAPAVQALVRTARQRGLTSLAVELERREADRVADPFARAVRYAALAETVEASRNVEEATVLYERALGLDATNGVAFDALDRIYRASGQWTRLIALHEAALASTADKRRGRALRLELAELVHVRGKDPVRAAELLRASLSGPLDGYDTLVRLARAAADAGRWSEYVEVLEAQASMLSGTDEIAAVHRIAVALETRVKDPKRALATYEIVVDRAPRHEAATRAIVRLHEQESRFDKVIDAEHRLLDLATRPEDAVECWLRIARTAETKLGRVDEAIHAYTEALRLAPTLVPAMSALERLLRGKGDYRRLAQTLSRFADAASHPQTKARALARSAAILELCMDDSDSAVAAYTRALAVPADDAARHAALWALARLQEARGEWEALDDTLGRLLDLTTEDARDPVLARLARNAELRLGDLPRAAELYTALGPATLVDRLRLARLGGVTEDITHALASLAASTSDERLEAGLWRVLALLHEHTGGAPAATTLYQELVLRDPTDPQALDGLVRCVGLAADDARHSRSLLARARATDDLPLRALLSYAGGVIDESHGRYEDAELAYAHALLADPDFVPALDGVRRLRAGAGDWDKAALAAERLAKCSRDAENAADAWLETGRIYEESVFDDDRAITAYRALLASQPAHPKAHARALALVEAVGEWADAAKLLGAHADAVTDAETQIGCLVHRARLLASRLGDVPGAIADLRRALALRDEEDAAILEVLAGLEERMKNWPEALGLWGRVSNAAVDAAVRRKGRLAEARILAEELRDHARARVILEDLARPDDREVLMRLAAVAGRLGDETRALDLYRQLSSSGSAPERARALVALAEFQRVRPDESEATLARAFDLAIADPSVLPVLEERAAKDGDYRPFVTHAEAAAARVPPHTAGVLPMRLALARTLREKLGNPGAADRQLAAAIQAFPDSMSTRLTLAAALRGRSDEGALAELRRAVEHDPSQPEPYLALVTLLLTTGRPSIGAMVASAAALLGGTSDEIEVTLSDASPLRPIAESFLFEESLTRIIGPSRAWFVRSIFAAVEPFLPKIFPGAEQVLEASKRLPDTYPLASDLRGIAAAVGCAAPIVARGTAREPLLLLTEPRALVFGPDMLADAARSLATFQGASACTRIAANGSLFMLPRQQIGALVEAIAKPDAEGPLVRDLRKRISSAMPRKNKKDLERLVAAAGPVDAHAELTAWEAEEARRALFTGVLMSRDLRAAFPEPLPASLDERRRAVNGNVRLRDVLEFVVSPACWDAFKRIYGRL